MDSWGSPSTASRAARGAALGAVAIAAAGALAVGAFSVLVARHVVTPSSKRLDDVKVLSVTENTVSLSSNADSRLPGVYGFWFSHGTGYARFGDVLEWTDSTVTRVLLGVDHGDLAGARGGYIVGSFYRSPAELGYPFEDVVIPTSLGAAPAWRIDPQQPGGRWLIGVHGRGVRRQECLRAVEVARRCGYTSLLISYRNDHDAPPSEDGRYGLGDTEWLDVDAALRYAVERGATEVVLMGWSMGGATVLQAVSRSDTAAVVRGLILESPVVDWATTLEYQARAMHIPVPLRRAAVGLIGTSWSGRLTGLDDPIDFDRLDFVRRAAELTLPILLLHSADDGYVPPSSSRELAASRPDIVTFDEFTVARHTKLWNYDRERWNTSIGSWLSRL